MEHFSIFKWQKFGTYLFRMFLILMLCLIAGCSSENSADPASGSSETGSAIFSIALHEATDNQQTSKGLVTAQQAESVPCVLIDSIDCIVYDASGIDLTSATFDCDDHQGTIDSIPVGSDYELTILGMSDGYILCHGEIPGVTITAGQTNDLGVVDVYYPFQVSPLISPTDGATVTAGEFSFQWTGLDDAYEYNIVVATGSAFDTVILDTLTTGTTFTPSAPLDSGTYYWMVLPVDSHSNYGLESEVWSFEVTSSDLDDIDDDGDGYAENQGDCNDNDETINPGATEVCGDEIDQDCDGSDLDCPPDPNDIDDDGDGYTENQGDCDDSNGSINPGATEICGDEIDQDCDGSDLPCPSDPNDIDDDGDGYTENQGDCDDNDESINPGATEVCGDEIDQDCDGSDLACTDTTPPTISITSPVTSATYTTTSPTLTIGGTASDNVGVTQVTWSNNRGGSGTCSGTNSWSASGITLSSGSNVITVTARDAAGNTGTDTLTVTYNPPDEPPIIAITIPTSSGTYTTTSSTLTIGGTASDDVGITQVTWSNNRGGSGTCRGTTSWSASGITLYNGNNGITVTAHDAAGNTGTDTITIEAILETVPPHIGAITHEYLGVYDECVRADGSYFQGYNYNVSFAFTDANGDADDSHGGYVRVNDVIWNWVNFYYGDGFEGNVRVSYCSTSTGNTLDITLTDGAGLESNELTETLTEE